MTEACVVAVYDSPGKAESAVHILHRADFPAGRISLVAATLEGHPDAIEDLAMKDDSIRDAAIGAGFGAF